MKIISAVGEHGGGHAWLETGIAVHEGMRVVIKRDAEKNCFLGPDGWQNLPAEIVPLQSARANRETALLLGPDVVDRLKDGDYVTISIPGTTLELNDFWPPIPVSGGKWQGGGIVAETKKAARAAVSPLPQASTPPTPATPHSSPGPETRVEEHTIVPDETSPRPWRKPMAIAAAVFLAVLLAAGGYYGWRQIPEGAIAGLPERVAGAAGDLGQNLFGGTPRDTAYWTNILRDPAHSPDQLYGFAVEARSNADTRDISHEFLYQAALRGNGQAQRDYSRLYDPTVSEATGWEARKNARTALEFYTRLRDGGDAQASQDISRVCAFLKPDIFINAESRTSFGDYCAQ